MSETTYHANGALVSDDAEQSYPPVPGGMVDTVRRQQAAGQAQLDAHNEAQAAQQPRVKMTVDVDVQGVPIANGRTFALAKQGFEQILPANPKRLRATIQAPDSAVVICFSLQQANDPQNITAAAGTGSNGFLLAQNASLTTYAQCPVYAVNPSGSALARVSVMWDAYPEGEG